MCSDNAGLMPSQRRVLTRVLVIWKAGNVYLLHLFQPNLTGLLILFLVEIEYCDSLA